MIEIKACLLAVGRLSLLKFFPSDPVAHSELAKLFQRMVQREDQLEWLVDALIDHVGEWPGPRELRGIFCTRCRPADGIEEWARTPGFSPSDCEARNIEEARGDKQIEGPRTCAGLKRLT